MFFIFFISTIHFHHNLPLFSTLVHREAGVIVILFILSLFSLYSLSFILSLFPFTFSFYFLYVQFKDT